VPFPPVGIALYSTDSAAGHLPCESDEIHTGGPASRTATSASGAPGMWALGAITLRLRAHLQTRRMARLCAPESLYPFGKVVDVFDKEPGSASVVAIRAMRSLSDSAIMHESRIIPGD
jgi:hypothetical protein